MANKPLVSVIVPTHNRPDFLEKTLQSILKQTYKNLQIIVVSNGFNQKNKEIVENLKDKRILYKEQENSGSPSSPRNHGIRLSKGKYVAFCDDDDLWMPEKIEKQVEALEKNLNYDLCYSKMLRFDGKKEWAIPHEEGPSTLKSLLYVNTIPISSVFIRKKNLDIYGGFSEDPKVGTAEDYEFLLRHAVHSNFLFIDEYLIKYWSGSNRMTPIDDNRTLCKNLKYFAYIIGCYYILYKKNDIQIKILFKPIFFHLKNLIKTLGYLGLKKLRLK